MVVCGWPFSGGWLGYLCVSVLAFVSHIPVWTSAVDSADDYIKITISLLLCDFQAQGTASLHLLSFSALTARHLHSQS